MPLEHLLPRGFEKGLAEAGAAFITLPWILQQKIYTALFGPIRACMASSQRASPWPGIIGAGSIVTKPVPDFAIMAGNPTRQIGDRRSAQPPPEARPA